ncbi:MULTISPECIES: hypothetical protein [unclassified Arthrobacter]|uniref:hypothetical protein n=1 Tax=unclassified Arthrobacter TaxID=235627 RepID=UPI00159E1E95|nr:MULTISPECIES: hypothetical protein [unclassified Arthrobacter]MCQ9162851.1 hypothetical protein [Arthrobacter sp. STN4]NVM98969.1 hypothetical protein [Arthrobacter sp. SDTb3-6]
MAHWQETLTVWGPAWAAIRGLDDPAAEQILAWPVGGGAAPQGGTVHLVTEDVAAARGFAAGAHLRETGTAVLLSALTDDLDLVPHMPPNTNLAEVPLENYDAVEVALFDRPVAGGRVKVAEGLAVLGGLHVDPEGAGMEAALEAVMIASLGDEAFLHGADVLYLVAGDEQAARLAAAGGWAKVADILSFTP